MIGECTKQGVSALRVGLGLSEDISMSKSVIIAGSSFGFPNGTGAAARARCYATGLRDAGVRVRVVVLTVLRPGDPEDLNDRPSGTWEGIDYEYASGTTGTSPSFLGRRRLEIEGMRRLARLIREGGARGDLAGVVAFGNRLRWALPIRVACSRAGVPYVQERSEHPMRFDMGPVARAVHYLRMRWVLSLPDGVLVISRCLEDSFAPFLARDAWMLRVPILVDVGRFDASGPAEPGVIGYLGNLGHPEELHDLVRAAVPLAEKDPAVRVRIMGPGTAAQRRAVLEQADTAGLSGRVELPGPVSADDLPKELAHASVLVLARADGLFSRAGMPTKLGEYLASGRPVVVTATGDIPAYLHDGVDSYLVTPGDIDGLTAAIDRALHDPGSAELGVAGRRLAGVAFDPRTHMRRLLAALAGDSADVRVPSAESGRT